MEIFTVENLSFKYPLCGAKALERVSFKVEQGDFLCICGATGSGKSTLLRMLKRELTPLGEKSGGILFRGEPLEALSDRRAASEIGFVAQRPEQQIVADRVWHELAFGLENLGADNGTIRRRVSEMACYFGIEDWFDKNTSELSGGQKQLLNLASVMVMQPEAVILDEPTAQLDPIAASGFISTLAKLNRELALTVIIVEHRLEEVVPVSNRLLALENGSVAAFGETRSAVEALRGNKRMLEAMPSAVRLYAALDSDDACPLDVREGRAFVGRHLRELHASFPVETPSPTGKPALQFSEVYYRYSRELPDVLRGLDFTVYEREIFFILGGNGSGKSTALNTAAGLCRPYSGCVRVFKKKLSEYKNQSLYRNCLAMLPQDVQTVFLKNTVREELSDAGAQDLSLPFDLSPLYEKHPYDLSGGEQQLVALAKALASKPSLLLLDEPTKGLDAYAKKRITGILKSLSASGVTCVVVSHDVEFAAETADRCAMFFRGEITSLDAPRRFFASNSFYTTAISRMTRGYIENAVTVGDLVMSYRGDESGDGLTV